MNIDESGRKIFKKTCTTPCPVAGERQWCYPALTRRAKPNQVIKTFCDLIFPPLFVSYQIGLLRKETKRQKCPPAPLCSSLTAAEEYKYRSCFEVVSPILKSKCCLFIVSSTARFFSSSRGIIDHHKMPTHNLIIRPPPLPHPLPPFPQLPASPDLHLDLSFV